MRIAIFTTTLLCIITMTAHAQNKEKIKGNRNVKLVQTPIELFGSIDIGEDMEVSLVQGENPMIEVEADENLHEVIHFLSFNGLLTVQTSKQITSSKTLKIRIYHTGELVSIVAREDAVIRSLSDLNLKKLTLSATNSAKLYLTLQADEFKFTGSEKSKAELTLKAKNATFVVNEDARIKATGNIGDCKIDMYQKSEAKISGSANYLSLRLDNSASYSGEAFIANQCNLVAESKVDCYVNAANNITIEASDDVEVYLYNTPKINLNKFAGNAILYKKQ